MVRNVGKETKYPRLIFVSLEHSFGGHAIFKKTLGFLVGRTNIIRQFLASRDPFLIFRESTVFQCFSARHTNIRIFWHLPVASQQFKFASSTHVLQAPNISVVAKMEESSPVLSCMDVRYLVTQPTMRIMGPSTSVQPCLPWLLLVQNPGRNHGGIVYTLPPRHGGGTSVTLSSSLVVVF